MTSSADPTPQLMKEFGLSQEEAEFLLLLSHEVDRTLAIQTFGYPKDNWMPGPLLTRLQDPSYLTMLLAEAKSDDETPTHLLQRLHALTT